jgi:hypothetical protein
MLSNDIIMDMAGNLANFCLVLDAEYFSPVLFQAEDLTSVSRMYNTMCQGTLRTRLQHSVEFNCVTSTY